MTKLPKAFLALLLGFAPIVSPPTPAIAAAAGPWDENPHVRMRLVAAVEAVGESRTLTLGLQFRMRPGWKIYWRSPGDAGYPPKPDWSGSRNLAGTEMRWPAPSRFSIFGMETLGYKDEVVLPIVARLERPGEALDLRATVDYLTCKEICVPYKAKAVLRLPAGPATASPLANLIARYAERVPGPGARHGLAIERVALIPDDGKVVLRVDAKSREPFAAPDLFVEGPVGTFFDRPEATLAEDGRRVALRVVGDGFETTVGEEVKLTLTLVDGARAMEKAVVVRLGAATSAPGSARPAATGTTPLAAPSTPLVTILLLAVLGGLILNLMPCVLPVLSLKLLSVVGHGGRAAGEVRIGFVASAAGILFSFLLLATGLVAVKAAGLAVGWGIQFQQPVFLVAMTTIVTLFACNLFGLFEARLPRPLADFAARHGDGRSLAGHFLTGAFATLLATPCSAPFLGTAVGFALSRGPVEIFLVFAALGLGLALPYLAVAAVPGLATRLPRPGRWMMTLRRILGLALAATAVWLLTVLGAQIGTEGALVTGAFMVLIAMVLALRHMRGSRVGRHAGKVALALSAAAVAAAAMTVPPPAPVSTPESGGEIVWQPFDRGRIPRLVAAGKTVFVDVTADWCITCQANKKLVLEREPVRSWLRAPDTVAMVADWTRPDPAIADYLASFGRYGIPFNAVYGPKAPRGIVLPELLTPDAVLAAVERAGGDTRFAGR